MSEKMPFESTNIEDESAANLILIAHPKNIELLNAVDTIRRRLQGEGADVDTFFRLKKNYKRACKTTLNKLLLSSILRDWNNGMFD